MVNNPTTSAAPTPNAWGSPSISSSKSWFGHLFGRKATSNPIKITTISPTPLPQIIVQQATDDLKSPNEVVTPVLLNEDHKWTPEKHHRDSIAADQGYRASLVFVPGERAEDNKNDDRIPSVTEVGARPSISIGSNVSSNLPSSSSESSNLNIHEVAATSQPALVKQQDVVIAIASTILPAPSAPVVHLANSAPTSSTSLPSQTVLNKKAQPIELNNIDIQNLVDSMPDSRLDYDNTPELERKMKAKREARAKKKAGQIAKRTIHNRPVQQQSYCLTPCLQKVKKYPKTIIAVCGITILGIAIALLETGQFENMA